MDLPRTGSLSAFLRARALMSPAAFAATLPGGAVLVRLDERGGRDEGAPWAFPSLEDMEVPASDDDDDDVFMDPSFAGSDEATATGPAQPPLAIPAAREMATVYVVPKTGGAVGRAGTSKIVVGERSVSRQHAMIANDAHWTILDLDSHNGTGVNGMPLVPGAVQVLRSGDVVHLGDVSFVFLDPQAFHSHLPALSGT